MVKPNSMGSMVVYVHVDTGLTLTLGRPCSIAPGLETFHVTGPDSAVRFVAGQVEDAKDEFTTGFL